MSAPRSSSYVTQLTCTLCGASSPPDDGNETTCARCGPLGIREVEYDYELVRRVFDFERLARMRGQILRFAPLLPFDSETRISDLELGVTPIYPAPGLAKELGLAHLYLKDDGRLPTASFKDRASFVGTARARQLGFRAIAAASTGNAATSVAGFAASMGLRAHIFVPATAPEAKIAQLLVYGAQVFPVAADYDRTFDLCQEVVKELGWYNRSAALNPYLVEGKKTCGLEIAEQMHERLPDWVAMAVGDGCSIAGTYKGLYEMYALGLSERVPKMLGVQASGAAPLLPAFASGGEDVVPVVARTIADSINVGTPRNPRKALRAVRRSGGAFVAVEDAAILDWLPRLGRATGVFAEPTAVAALAGVAAARAKGIIGPKESVLVVLTGNGLKDVARALQSVRRPEPVEPSLAAVQARLAPV